MKVFMFLLLTLSFQHALFADAAGSGDYNKCVLEKIRGQVRSTISHARRMCESEFPFEKKLRGYDKKVEIKWWSTQDTLHLAIQANHGDYRITRFNARFAKKPCDEIRGRGSTAYTITKEFIFEEEKEEASVFVGDEAGEYECMESADIYGIKIKDNNR